MAEPFGARGLLKQYADGVEAASAMVANRTSPAVQLGTRGPCQEALTVWSVTTSPIATSYRRRGRAHRKLGVPSALPVG